MLLRTWGKIYRIRRRSQYPVSWPSSALTHPYMLYSSWTSHLPYGHMVSIHSYLKFSESFLVCAKSLQLCLTFCSPIDCSLPGSSVHYILQARILEWVAMPSSRDLPNPGIKLTSPDLLHWQTVSLPLAPAGKPPWCHEYNQLEKGNTKDMGTKNKTLWDRLSFMNTKGVEKPMQKKGI